MLVSISLHPRECLPTLLTPNNPIHEFFLPHRVYFKCQSGSLISCATMRKSPPSSIHIIAPRPSLSCRLTPPHNVSSGTTHHLFRQIQPSLLLQCSFQCHPFPNTKWIPTYIEESPPLRSRKIVSTGPEWRQQWPTEHF